MISKIPEFIEWKTKIDGDLEGVKCIISEAVSDQDVKNLVDACGFTRDQDKESHFALHFKIAVDNYLQLDGWYRIMEEDKADSEEGDQAILDEEQSIRYNARMPL